MDDKTAKNMAKGSDMFRFLATPALTWKSLQNALSIMTKPELVLTRTAAEGIRKVLDLQVEADKLGLNQLDDDGEWQDRTSKLFTLQNPEAENVTTIFKQVQVLEDYHDYEIFSENDIVKPRGEWKWVNHRLLNSVAYTDKVNKVNIVAECGTTWLSQFSHSIAPATLVDLLLPNGMIAKRKKSFVDYYTLESALGKKDSMQAQTIKAMTALMKLNAFPYLVTGHSLGTGNLVAKTIDLEKAGCKAMINVLAFSPLPSITQAANDYIKKSKTISARSLFIEHDFAPDYVGPWTFALGLLNTMSASFPKDDKIQSAITTLAIVVETKAVAELKLSQLQVPGDKFRIPADGKLSFMSAHFLDTILVQLKKASSN